MEISPGDEVEGSDLTCGWSAPLNRVEDILKRNADSKLPSNLLALLLSQSQVSSVEIMPAVLREVGDVHHACETDAQQHSSRMRIL